MQVPTACVSLCLFICVLLFFFFFFYLTSGFTGQDCEHNIDDCVQHACENGGRCMDGVNTYNCHCDKHWTGTTHYIVLHNETVLNTVNRPTL